MFLSTMMHEAGNPTAVELSNDYSGASGKYAVIWPPANEVWGVKILAGTLESSTKFKPGDFGNITDGLTNGLRFECADDEDEYLSLGAGTIYTNEQFFYLMTKIQTAEEIFDTTEYIYKFEVDFGIKGEVIILDGGKNQRLQVYLNDNLSSLSSIMMFANGFKAVRGVRSIGKINERYILPIHDHGNQF